MEVKGAVSLLQKKSYNVAIGQKFDHFFSQYS